MRARMVWMGAVLASACQGGEAPRSEPQKRKPPAEQIQPATQSASFHLEIGGVHERFQDAKGAVEHLTQAVALAQDGFQRASALSALARVRESTGDVDGAIEALERGMTEEAKAAAAQASGPSGAAPRMGVPGDDALLQLARLHATRGRFEDALRLCERGLSSDRPPWQLEQFLRLQVDLLRKTGGLEARVAEAEKGLEGEKPDESTLRFLLLALRSDAAVAPAPGVPPGAAPSKPAPVPPALIRAHQRLHDLHPEDAQVRQGLLSLLEGAGRIDEAVAVARSAQGANPAECAVALGAPAQGRFEGMAEAARIRARAGQKDKALAEAARVAALASREGVPAFLAAAEIYSELGAGERANDLLRRAKARARSSDEARRVALTRERMLLGSGQRAASMKLYGEWEASGDACLRQAAAMRRTLAPPEPMPQHMAPPPSAE